jgi:hypothetical protein
MHILSAEEDIAVMQKLQKDVRDTNITETQLLINQNKKEKYLNMHQIFLLHSIGRTISRLTVKEYRNVLK